MNQNTRVRIGLVATVAAVIAGGSLAAAPAIAATPSCATAWTAGTAYSGGATVSENGSNYTANWWTQGDDPATHSGATGSGQPWTSTGACSGTGGGTTPPGGGRRPPARAGAAARPADWCSARTRTSP
ncbi:carbohydrate-binding protein [Curtobacterium sp. 24E2]|nr:hypothetical protein JN350_07725 [Curtobacterium sp. 24E2]